MCMQVKCQQCGKPTWAGCGAHIEQALANVPKSERCVCRETAQQRPSPSIGQPSPRPDRE